MPYLYSPMLLVLFMLPLALYSVYVSLPIVLHDSNLSRLSYSKVSVMFLRWSLRLVILPVFGSNTYPKCWSVVPLVALTPAGNPKVSKLFDISTPLPYVWRVIFPKASAELITFGVANYIASIWNVI